MKFFLYYSFLILAFYSCSNEKIAKLPPETKNILHKKDLLPAVSSPLPKTTESIDHKAPSDNMVEKPQSAVIKANEPSSSVTANTYVGTVTGTQTSQLSFRVSGYVGAILVKNGDYVKKGQVIARLDESIALEQLKLSRLALEQTEVAQHYADLSLKRTQTLNFRQATTKIALEQAEAGYKNSQIANRQAVSNLKLAQINYDDANLIAPFDGYLFNLTAWIGNYISSATPLVTLSSPNDLQIRISIPQTITNNFTLGKEFSFSNSSQKVTGVLKITAVVPYVDTTSKTYLLFATPVSVQGQLMAGELIVVNAQ